MSSTCTIKPTSYIPIEMCRCLAVTSVSINCFSQMQSEHDFQDQLNDCLIVPILTISGSFEVYLSRTFNSRPLLLVHELCKLKQR